MIQPFGYNEALAFGLSSCPRHVLLSFLIYLAFSILLCGAYEDSCAQWLQSLLEPLNAETNWTRHGKIWTTVWALMDGTRLLTLVQ